MTVRVVWFVNTRTPHLWIWLRRYWTSHPWKLGFSKWRLFVVIITRRIQHSGENVAQVMPPLLDIPIGLRWSYGYYNSEDYFMRDITDAPTSAKLLSTTATRAPESRTAIDIDYRRLQVLQRLGQFWVRYVGIADDIRKASRRRTWGLSTASPANVGALCALYVLGMRILFTRIHELAKAWRLCPQLIRPFWSHCVAQYSSFSSLTKFMQVLLIARSAIKRSALWF